MSDQSKTPPAKTAAPANAAAASAAPAAKVEAPKVQAPQAEPVKPADAAKSIDTVIAKALAPAEKPDAAAKASVAASALAAKPQAAKVEAVKAKTAKPVTAKTVPSKPNLPKMAKPAAKTAAPKATKTKSAVLKTPVAAKAAAPVMKKETTMNTTETMTAEAKNTAAAMTDRVKGLMGDMSTRAKTAYEKGTEMVSQATEFSKGNVEALVESGKIAAKGAQEMGQSYAEDTKKGFEELTAALKEMTTVKSPTEFIELQTRLVKKSFDTAVAQTSKNSEMFLKLAGDAFQPISNRVSVAVDSFKKAA
ncbi:phasin family protein [Blastomonas sp.]|uniref:phasin family protein n=1 Tax=Blastomonas sp. TaxID=1909299 RepID=UPI0026231A04|nr:phasin family protein [Blastomonas sp.]MDM7956540.1 phasin family protein [Blastomonas sp.]